MPEFDHLKDNSEKNGNSYPDYFKIWDESLKKQNPTGFFDSDEFTDIIEIYLSEERTADAVSTFYYAYELYRQDDDFIYDILALFDDYERWSDLLDICNKFAEGGSVWFDANRLSALLHLRMEEDAFHLFGKAKKKYRDEGKKLPAIYQYMAEALSDVDLYDASVAVADESLRVLGERKETLWLQLQNYQSLDKKDKVLDYAEKIQKKDPFDIDTWGRLGEIYREMGEIEKSIDAYEFVRSLGGHDPEDILNLVYDYENNGNDAKALEIIEEFIVSYPDNYMALVIASNISAKIEEWDKAIDYIDRAIALSPGEKDLYLSKAEYLINIEEYKKAEGVLKEGIKATEDPGGELEKKLGELKGRS